MVLFFYGIYPQQVESKDIWGGGVLGSNYFIIKKRVIAMDHTWYTMLITSNDLDMYKVVLIT